MTSQTSLSGQDGINPEQGASDKSDRAVVNGAASVSAVPASVPSASSRLQAAVTKGKEQGKLALYFGCLDDVGHYLHRPNGRKVWQAKEELPGFPWTDGLMDTGLLKNGKRADVYDGKVFWTCGGLAFWYAFFWWDRSVDKRGASNSGFYVRGFDWPEIQEAFDYACGRFPAVVARQKQPLSLVYPYPSAQAIEARRAVTGTGAVHESAVGLADAPEPAPDINIGEHHVAG